jgi:glucan biosynthesis protein
MCRYIGEYKCRPSEWREPLHYWSAGSIEKRKTIKTIKQTIEAELDRRDEMSPGP